MLIRTTRKIECNICKREFTSINPKDVCSGPCEYYYIQDYGYKGKFKAKECAFCYRFFITNTNKEYCNKFCLRKLNTRRVRIKKDCKTRIQRQLDNIVILFSNLDDPIHPKSFFIWPQ